MAKPVDESHLAYQLLARAQSPDSAHRLFLDKVIHKPLLLRASSPPQSAKDARERRQQARLARREQRRKSNKPRPLNAKQKRALCVYEIPASERRYELYVPLKCMWEEYMREILNVGADGRTSVTPAAAGPMLASAEFVGAEVEVVRSRCVSRVGLKGIVVKDLKFVFEVITTRNEVKSRHLLHEPLNSKC
jgi:ribonuclease P protein subunit POP4